MQYEYDEYATQSVRSEKNSIVIKVLIEQQTHAKFNYIRKFQ